MSKDEITQPSLKVSSVRGNKPDEGPISLRCPTGFHSTVIEGQVTGGSHTTNHLEGLEQRYVHPEASYMTITSTWQHA